MKVGTVVGALAPTVMFVGQMAVPLNALLLLLIKRASPKSRIIWSLFLLTLMYLSYHFFFGASDLSDAIKNFARMALPVLVALIAVKQIEDINRGQIDKIILGTVIVCAIDLSGVLLYMASTLDFSNIYNIKDKNLVFQNTNYTAFALYCSFVAHVSLINKRRRSGRMTLVLLSLMLLTYSRSYWAATVITIMMSIHPPRRFLLFLGFVVASFAPILIGLHSIDTQFIRENFDSSLATKFEILLYTASFFENGQKIGFWGIGPKVFVEDFIITHSGHSLYGMFPELGVMYFAYVSFFGFFLIKGGRYSLLHAPGTFLLLFSTFPVSNLALHVVYLLLSKEISDDS